MNKPGKHLGFLSGLVIAGLGGLVTLLSNTLFKDWLIIGFGIRTFSFVKTVGLGIVGLGIVLTIILAIPAILATIRDTKQSKQAAQEAARNATVPQDVNDPLVIRNQFSALRKRLPELSLHIDDLEAQMDQMDALQTAQNQLISDNRATYLSNTEESLNNVETCLCQNMRSFLNYCIFLSDGISDFDITKFSNIHKKNDELLGYARKLGQLSVEYIDGYNSGRGSNIEELKALIATIEDRLSDFAQESPNPPSRPTPPQGTTLSF